MTRDFGYGRLTLLGVLGLIAFSVFNLSPLAPYLWGQTPMLTRGSGHPQSAADLGDIVSTVGFSCMCMVMAAVNFLAWKNYRIEVRPDGIRRKNFLGRVNFHSPWSALQEVNRRPWARAGNVFEVYSADGKLSFGSFIPDYLALMRAIEAAAPDLDYSPWYG